MGQQTDIAMFEIERHLSDPSLRGILVLRERGSNRLSWWFARYGEGEDFDHVEMALFKRLADATNAFADIPNEAKVIFVCNWSPCAECTATNIPGICKAVFGGVKQAVELSFVYRYVYSKVRYTYAKRKELVFDTDELALAAYQKLNEDMSKLYTAHWTPVGFTGPFATPGNIIEKPRTRFRLRPLEWTKRPDWKGQPPPLLPGLGPLDRAGGNKT
jgi:hypothetical protein